MFSFDSSATNLFSTNSRFQLGCLINQSQRAHHKWSKIGENYRKSSNPIGVFWSIPGKNWDYGIIKESREDLLWDPRELVGTVGKATDQVTFQWSIYMIHWFLSFSYRDSKNQFLFNVLQDDGGDQGKLEAFINFCEDTIFEMQHAAEVSLVKGIQGGLRGKVFASLFQIYRISSNISIYCPIKKIW